MIDIEALKKKLDSQIESGEFDKHLDEYLNHRLRITSRAEKFGIIYDSMTYDRRVKLIERIEKKHDDRWRILCHNEGYEMKLWNIANVLFDAAEMFGSEHNGEPLDNFDANFGAYTILYGDLYFNWIYGQGTILRIFDKDKMEIFRSK